jgi:hypothetical protein
MKICTLSLVLLMLAVFLYAGLALSCGDDDDDSDRGGSFEDPEDDDDDDAIGDDDDFNPDDDDDDDDDDTVSESYIYDDGTDEYYDSPATAGSYLLTEMIPSAFPAFLTEISAYILTGSSNAFHMVVFADENGDGPELGELAFLGPGSLAPGDGSWFIQDLSQNELTLASGRWLVGAKWTVNFQPTIGLDQDSGHTQLACDDTFTCTSDDNDTLMIRGEGYYVQ